MPCGLGSSAKNTVTHGHTGEAMQSTRGLQIDQLTLDRRSVARVWFRFPASVLIHTDTLCLTQTHILEPGSVRLDRIQPVLLRWVQNLTSLRSDHFESDPPNLTESNDAPLLKIHYFLDPCGLAQICFSGKIDVAPLRSRPRA